MLFSLIRGIRMLFDRVWFLTLPALCATQLSIGSEGGEVLEIIAAENWFSLLFKCARCCQSARCPGIWTLIIQLADQQFVETIYRKILYATGTVVYMSPSSKIQLDLSTVMIRAFTSSTSVSCPHATPMTSSSCDVRSL